jgi:hypothetical protein
MMYSNILLGAAEIQKISTQASPVSSQIALSNNSENPNTDNNAQR